MELPVKSLYKKYVVAFIFNRLTKGHDGLFFENRVPTA